jgi:hypothetical protein
MLLCRICFAQDFLTVEVFNGFSATSQQTGQEFYIQISKVVIDKPTNAVYCHFDAYNSKTDLISGKDKISTRAFQIPLTEDLQGFIDTIFQTAYKQTLLNSGNIPAFNITSIDSFTMEVSE